MNILNRVKSYLGLGNGAQEGLNLGPFTGYGEFGSPFSIESNGDGWQRSLNVDTSDARHVSIVYACVMLYCRAISQCQPKHLVRGDDGADTQSKTSPASRVLRYPNAYETWSQFIFNVGAEVGFEGESLALKIRDSRNAVAGFHRVPRRGWSIHVDPETKEIFYGLNDTDLYHKPEMLVPQREVVHFRQHCPRHPLIGESSVKASALSVGINVALSKSQLYFFNQMARPSGVLSTDLSLNAEQVSQLRARFDDQSKYWNQGRVPILTNGLKWAPVNISQADSQLIEQQRLSALEVARVFSVPMALLAEGSGPQAGTAALITTWLSLGLGSLIENIERSLDRAFELPANEHIQLDTTPLLRSDPGSRAEMWSKNIQSGTMTINEVRLREGLAPVEGGDTPMVQQQMVGIDLLQQLHAATIASKLKPKADPDPDPAPAAAPPKDDDKEFDGEVTRALIVDMFKRKRA